MGVGTTGFSPMPFHRKGNNATRFLRDSCCVCLFLSAVILMAVILPVVTAMNIPIVNLPDRTAVFHTSPTKKAAWKAANKDPLLRALIVLTSAQPAEGASTGGAAATEPAADLGAAAPSTKPNFDLDNGFKGCRGPTDQDVWHSKGGKADFADYMNECGNTCMGTYNCVEKCITKDYQYSNQCVACFADLTKCSKDHCLMQCMMGSDSPKCSKCVRKHCNPGFAKCSGIPKKDLPAKGVKSKPSLLNIEGTLTMRRYRRSEYGRTHAYLFAQDGLVVSDALASALQGASGQLTEIEQNFKNRPLCRDEDSIIAQATGNEFTSCAQVAPLCEDPQFGHQLKIACPATCKALSPVCDSCANQDSILAEATNGEVSTCTQAAPVCDDPQFGAALLQACPVTCDACGVKFSTPPPTPEPVSASEATQAQSMVINKILDGTLVEDTGTAAIRVATENPKGPRGALDGWGYVYAMVSLSTPYLSVDIKPALWPIVWHRPEGFPFDFRDFPPYNGAKNQGGGGAEADDDAGRRLQEDAVQDAGYDAGYDAQGDYGEGAAGGSAAAYAQAASAASDPYPYADPVPGYATPAVPVAATAAATAYAAADTGPACRPTTIAHVEFPRETIRAGEENMLVVGVSAHITKAWLDANRDFLEASAYPIAKPLARAQMEAIETPDKVVDALEAQLDIDGMGRPAPPDIPVTFGGSVPVSAAYGPFTVSADMYVKCQAVLNARQLSMKQTPDIDCGAWGWHNVRNLHYMHNLWIFGGIFFLSFLLVGFVWCLTDWKGCLGSGAGAHLSADDLKTLHVPADLRGLTPT